MSARTYEFLFGMSFCTIFIYRAFSLTVSLWFESLSAESVAWYFSVSQFNVDVLNKKSLSLHVLDVKVKKNLQRLHNFTSIKNDLKHIRHFSADVTILKRNVNAISFEFDAWNHWHSTACF